MGWVIGDTAVFRAFFGLFEGLLNVEDERLDENPVKLVGALVEECHEAFCEVRSMFVNQPHDCVWGVHWTTVGAARGTATMRRADSRAAMRTLAMRWTDAPAMSFFRFRGTRWREGAVAVRRAIHLPRMRRLRTVVGLGRKAGTSRQACQ